MDWSTLAQSNLPSVNPQSTYRPTLSTYNGQGGPGLDGGGDGGHQQQQPAAAPQPPRFVPLETAKERYEEEMLEYVFNKALEDARNATSRLTERNRKTHWGMQRDRWSHGLSNYSTSPPSSSTTADHDDHQHYNDGPNLLALGGGVRYQNTNGNVLAIHSGTNSSAATNHHRPHFRNVPALGSLDIKQVRDHYAIVRNMVQRSTTTTATTSGFSSTAVATIEEFTNLSVQSSERLFHEYVSVWKIISRSIASGGSSPPAEERARLTALALGYRFRETMMVRLPQQQTTTTTIIIRDMKKEAVEFQNSFVIGDMTAWPAVYFCLRCGDAKAAQSLIEQQRGSSSSGFDFDPAVASLINILATSQGQADSVWEMNLEYLFLDAHKIVAVKDLLETMKDNPNHNKYEAGVYSLLAGMTPVLSETLEGFKTTEDYAYTSVCIVLLHAADTSEGLADLGKEIIQQGPTYFRSISTWEYFLPLIAAQQYHRALDWLIRIAPIQATHLALGLMKANIAIQNHGEADHSDETMAGMLVKYAALMEYPEVALTYLSLIADRIRARTEMARIVANQPDIAMVAGTINPADGVRVGGVLDDIVPSREEVSEILVAAASLLRVQKGDNKNIVLCLMQAERFDDVLLMMNSLLVPVDKPDHNRGFWVDNTKFFLRDFVDISPSPVLQYLAKAGKLGILEESRLLVQLNDFMVSRQSSLAESLELLPRSQDEFKHKKRRFDDFSAAVQKAYSPFLMLRMRALAEANLELKSQMGGYNADATRQNIQRNEQLSDLYIRFAEAINLPATERRAIIQLGSTIS